MIETTDPHSPTRKRLVNFLRELTELSGAQWNAPLLDPLQMRGNRGMTSSDGIRWSTQPTPGQNWVALCWAAEMGLYVAVSGSGTGQRLMTSSDGHNWTLRTAAAVNS